MKKLVLLLLTIASLLLGYLYFPTTSDLGFNHYNYSKENYGSPQLASFFHQDPSFDSLINDLPKGKRLVLGDSKIEYLVTNGDTFLKILRKFHVNSQIARKLSNLIHQKLDMSLFKRGKLITIHTKAGEESPFRFEYSIDLQVVLDINVTQLRVALVEKPIQLVVKTLQSSIKGSLTNSIVSKGAPADLADKLLSLFAWDINFKKLNKTDQFKVIYEDKIVEGKSIGAGKVIAAWFKHGKEQWEAHFFEKGNVKGYFDDKGKNVSRAPVAYDIISSLYSRKRFHPVKRRYRAHLGVDFMADEGTPVTALKAGIVIKAGYTRANGNYVKIKHNNIISTQYLHLSSISSGVKTGSRVKRGDVIGEVGSTGLSSGPHLCLRLWKNGRQVDPLNYEFERQAGVPAELMEEYNELVNSQNQYNKEVAASI